MSRCSAVNCTAVMMTVDGPPSRTNALFPVVQRAQPAGASLQPAGPVPAAPGDQPALPGPGEHVHAGQLRVLARGRQDAHRDRHQCPQGGATAVHYTSTYPASTSMSTPPSTTSTGKTTTPVNTLCSTTVTPPSVPRLLLHLVETTAAHACASTSLHL